MDLINHPITFPGVTFASTQKLEDLLKKNHAFHIYFDGIKHNHIAHNLIAIYTLGATADDLQAVFDKHCHLQKPLLAPQFDDPVHTLADPHQFRAYMGEATYYTDYLTFFDHQIQQHGVLATFQTYYGDRNSDIGAQMRFQGLNGVLHGLIHVGYGLELNHPLLMAEGLALCAVERQDFDPTTAAFAGLLFDPLSNAMNGLPSSSSSSSSSLLDVFQQLYAAKDVLAPGSAFEYRRDLTTIGSVETSAKIEAICNKWQVKADAADIKIKLKELLALTFHLYSTTMHVYPAPHFDFFLMHTLTSGYFIPLVISHLSDLDLQATMLKVCCRWFATEYILVGLPKVHSEWLSQPIPTHGDDGFSWSEIIHHAITDSDEHVAKAIRSLVKLDLCYGKHEQHNPYLKVAQMTIGFRKRQDDAVIQMPWFMSGIGYKN